MPLLFAPFCHTTHRLTTPGARDIHRAAEGQMMQEKQQLYWSMGLVTFPCLSRPHHDPQRWHPVNATVYSDADEAGRRLVDHVAVVFDVARKTFRSDIFPEYKANRSEPPEDLIPQFALVREATAALACQRLSWPGLKLMI